mmetsp:Transcript_38877/g.117413  ORF Transcript_38877/g.117413 Transcript_38877/m.117413 type:complete len:268 (+) Transcript_38877:741-1544(+)
MLRRRHGLEKRFLAMWGSALRRPVEAHPVHHRQHAPCGSVYGSLAFLRKSFWPEVIAGIVADARHLLVEALPQAFLVRRPPIRLHEAFEPHLVVQNGELLLAGTRMLAVDSVVRAHDRGYASVDGGLERRVIQLPCGLLVDNRRLVVAVRLLLVEDPMLNDGEHPLRLHALHVRRCEARPQVWVLARHVLEVASVAGGAVNVHRRAQNRIRALARELAAQRLPKSLHRRRVPCCAHGEERRPHGNRAHDLGEIRAEAASGVLHVQAW